MNDTSNPFQSVVSLGKLHSYDNSTRNNRFVMSGATLAGMSCCLCMTAYAFIDEANHPGAKPSDISPAFMFGMIIFMMFIGASLIYLFVHQWWKIRKVAVGVFEQGLAYSDAEGAISLIPWASIQKAENNWIQSERIRFVQYYVTTRDGEHYLLHHSLKDVHQLAAIIRKITGLEPAK